MGVVERDRKFEALLDDILDGNWRDDRGARASAYSASSAAGSRSIASSKS
jgi:hypothetical protein